MPNTIIATVLVEVEAGADDESISTTTTMTDPAGGRNLRRKAGPTAASVPLIRPPRERGQRPGPATARRGKPVTGASSPREAVRTAACEVRGAQQEQVRRATEALSRVRSRGLA